ncbi:unnamed protein product [Mytilus coruscus]|uniref:Uncharacterized protein n=1 Tax=Mytilus coruscus TaxID=42192 RepID=A0A6J8AS99_MYTCO|nr:unnamed protein product [Mytilus coruscus]
MKGYSLSTKSMSSMHSEIQQTCFKNGINIECSNFDGQWLRLATSDEHDKPLTLLQLQRDTWEEAKKANRDQILTIFSKALIAPAIENDLLLHKITGSLSVPCPLYKKLIDALEKRKIRLIQMTPEETIANPKEDEVMVQRTNLQLQIKDVVYQQILGKLKEHTKQSIANKWQSKSWIQLKADRYP